jgi:hypothetical protein
MAGSSPKSKAERAHEKLVSNGMIRTLSEGELELLGLLGGVWLLAGPATPRNPAAKVNANATARSFVPIVPSKPAAGPAYPIGGHRYVFTEVNTSTGTVEAIT